MEESEGRGVRKERSQKGEESEREESEGRGVRREESEKGEYM
jgi:hypothetical protein